MSKKSRLSRFMMTSTKRSGVAFGIAVMAVGYNMLPIKPPLAVSEGAGLFIMLMGIWVVLLYSNLDGA